MAFVASFLLLFNIFFFSAIFPISQSEAEDTIESVIETSPEIPEEKLDQDLTVVERVSTVGGEPRLSSVHSKSPRSKSPRNGAFIGSILWIYRS